MAAQTTQCFRWTIEDIKRKAVKEKLENDIEEQKEEMTIVHKEIKTFFNEDRIQKSVYVHSEVFAIPGYSFGARARLELNSLEVSLQLIDFYKIHLPITMRTFPMVTYARKDMDDDEDNSDRDMTEHVDCDFRAISDYNQWGYSAYLTQHLIGSRYDRCNRFQISIFFESPSIARSFASNNGVFIWRIDNYKAKKQKQLDGCGRERSPYFYVALRGYRMVASLSLKFGYLQIFFNLLTGEFDESLDGKFDNTTTVTLYNQTMYSKTLVKIAESCEGYHKSVRMIKIDSLENEGYVDNDSMTLRIDTV